MSEMLAARVGIEVAKLSSCIGAEVSGLDTRSRLDGATVAALRSALNEHKALIIRDARLSKDAQQRFAAHFGPLTTAHPTLDGAGGAPNVFRVRRPQGATNWHTDVTFVVNPPQLSTLCSITIPPYGGETEVANTAAAYRSLPEPLRHLADGLWAVHSNVYDYVGPESGSAPGGAAFTSIDYETVHPVVRVHPLTGERGLYIGGFARRIVGFTDEESAAVLGILQAAVIRAKHVLRWRWEPDQLLIYDNRVTQHHAVDNYDGQTRHLNRVTVAGDVPVAVDGSPSYSVKGDASHYSPMVTL